MKLEKWALIAEVGSGVAILVTLVVLVLQVRTNTAAIERQTTLERGARFDEVFMQSPMMPGLYAKIKEVDGAYDKSVSAFAKEYHLSIEESVVWTRHLNSIWSGFAADFDFYGPSPRLRRELQGLLEFPDQTLYWQHAKTYWSDEFASYVDTEILGRRSQEDR